MLLTNRLTNIGENITSLADAVKLVKAKCRLQSKNNIILIYGYKNTNKQQVNGEF